MTGRSRAVAAATAGAVLTGLLGVAGASVSAAAPALPAAVPPGTSSEAVALLAVTAFDLGTAVSDGRHNFSLNLYSIDRGRGSTATVIVNGTELELDHVRYPAPSAGRYRMWGRQPAWFSSDLSTFTLPDELLVDGTNIIQIQARGSLLIHGAYLESNAFYPEPDPDPDPCSDCPVAS
jgi:hypothetical protein